MSVIAEDQLEDRIKIQHGLGDFPIKINSDSDAAAFEYLDEITLEDLDPTLWERIQESWNNLLPKVHQALLNLAGVRYSTAIFDNEIIFVRANWFQIEKMVIPLKVGVIKEGEIVNFEYLINRVERVFLSRQRRFALPHKTAYLIKKNLPSHLEIKANVLGNIHPLKDLYEKRFWLNNTIPINLDHAFCKSKFIKEKRTDLPKERLQDQRRLLQKLVMLYQKSETVGKKLHLEIVSKWKIADIVLFLSVFNTHVDKVVCNNKLSPIPTGFKWQTRKWSARETEAAQVLFSGGLRRPKPLKLFLNQREWLLKYIFCLILLLGLIKWVGSRWDIWWEQTKIPISTLENLQQQRNILVSDLNNREERHTQRLHIQKQEELTKKQSVLISRILDIWIDLPEKMDVISLTWDQENVVIVLMTSDLLLLDNWRRTRLLNKLFPLDITHIQGNSTTNWRITLKGSQWNLDNMTIN